jgi:hypothetical protein
MSASPHKRTSGKPVRRGLTSRIGLQKGSSPDGQDPLFRFSGSSALGERSEWSPVRQRQTRYTAAHEDFTWDDRLPEADKKLVGDLNASLDRLGGLRALEINVSGKFLRSKIAWKLATYQRVLLHRLVALMDGAAVAWREIEIGFVADQNRPRVPRVHARNDKIGFVRPVNACHGQRQVDFRDDRLVGELTLQKCRD